MGTSSIIAPFPEGIDTSGACDEGRTVVFKTDLWAESDPPAASAEAKSVRRILTIDKERAIRKTDAINGVVPQEEADKGCEIDALNIAQIVTRGEMKHCAAAKEGAQQEAQ